MNILVVLNSLGLGGAETYTVGLINQFIEANHNVKLIVLSNELSLKDKLSSKVEVLILARRKKIDINVILKLRKHIQSGQYDTVISSYATYLKLALIFSNNYIKALFPIHSTIPLSDKYFIIQKILFKLKRKNELYITSIESQSKYMEKKYNLKNDFFYQIFNGIDCNSFTLPDPNFDKTSFLKRYNVNINNSIILMVAGYRVEKNHAIAIKAFELLRKENKNVSLVFIGNNSLNLMNKIKALVPDSLQELTFLTNINHIDLLQFYWSSDVFTLTSTTETFPITVLEAMATGLPCVLTKVGGVTDFLEQGVNGEYANNNDSQSIKEKWSYVIQNKNKYNKEEIRNTIKSNYSIEVSAKHYMELMLK